jgi:DNA-binding transcriptional MerR regulator
MMKLFSIKEVEDYTGIKAATVRMWERRYGVCIPERKSGGSRQYKLAELYMLLNIALLNKNGFKISKLANLSAQTLLDKVASLAHIEDRRQHAINRLIFYKFSTDVDAFESHLDECFKTFGIEDTLNDIIVPFLKTVNILYYSSTTNEVHLAVTLIRRKLIYYIESLAPLKSLNKTALLFLPQGEHYDLMLLYMQYMVKSAGLKPIYLGTNIAQQNIKLIVNQKKPDYLFTYLIPKSTFGMADVLAYLKETSPQQVVIIVAEDVPAHGTDENIKYIHFRHFRDVLQSTVEGD